MGLLNGFFKKSIEIKDRNKLLLEKFSFKSLDNKDLTKVGYESNVDAYAVIRKIVDTSKSINWIVERKTSEGWELMEDNTITPLLENPNSLKGYTWNDIQEQQLIYLLASGNSYLYGEEINGKIAELDVLPSKHVSIKSSQNFFLPALKYSFNLQKTKETYEAEEIEHIKLFNPSYDTVEESFKGLSAFQVAARVIKVGNDRWDADAHLLQNLGARGLITDSSDRPMLEPEAAAVQNHFNKHTTGTAKFGAVKVTNKDLKYIPMSMSSADLQLIEKGVITLRSMCNVFGLDSSLFNDPANKTFNNRKEAEKALYTNAVIPLSKKIAQHHTNYICKNHYPDGSVRMRQDFSNIEALQTDKKQEAEKDKIVVEGINVILQMPINKDSKIALLTDTYGLSEDVINKLKLETNE